MTVEIIYFIRNPKWGLIKIGTSRNIELRMRALSTEMGQPMEFIGALFGSFKDERILQMQFREWRVACEWFHPADELLTYIKDNALLKLDEVIQLHEKTIVARKSQRPIIPQPTQNTGWFYDYSHQQLIADKFNNWMAVPANTPAERLEKQNAYRLLKEFEQAKWDRDLFEDVFWSLKTQALRVLHGQLDSYTGNDPWGDIGLLLNGYLDRLPKSSSPEDN